MQFRCDVLFRIREFMLSGPAAFPGLSFESCFATPLTVMIMSGIFGKLYFLGRTAQQDDVT